jgi:hypothetical protein
MGVFAGIGACILTYLIIGGLFELFAPKFANAFVNIVAGIIIIISIYLFRFVYLTVRGPEGSNPTDAP